MSSPGLVSHIFTRRNAANFGNVLYFMSIEPSLGRSNQGRTRPTSGIETRSGCWRALSAWLDSAINYCSAGSGAFLVWPAGRPVGLEFKNVDQLRTPGPHHIKEHDHCMIYYELQLLSEAWPWQNVFIAIITIFCDTIITWHLPKPSSRV